MIRKTAVAGTFYPADPEELKRMVDGFLAAEDDSKFKNLRGIIAPHAGYIFSGKTAGMGFRQFASLPKKPRRVFILAPAHFSAVGVSVGDFESYETPLEKVEVDREICGELLQSPEFEFVPEAHAHEHSIEVQLPFLIRSLPNFKIVPILCGDISPKILASALEKYFAAEENLFVISSDLSHFFPLEIAQQKDSKTLGIITLLDFENAGEIDACGKIPILTAMQLAKKIRLLDYSTSAEASGDSENVVGYASLAIF
ncbi:MAG: AmmeMemoRadiSam system protein B [Patescibacteria group bacterium]